MTNALFSALAGLIGGRNASDLNQPPITTLTVDGALDITPTGNDTVRMTKGSALLLSVAAPGASGVGVTRRILSGSAFAHVVTFTGGTLESGAAGVTTATFPALPGSCITVLGVSATRWALVANNLVVIT
jgi:hypothetical protein